MELRFSEERELMTTEERRKRGISPFLFSSVVAIFLSALPALLAAQTPERARAEALSRRAAERLQALQREADTLAADERTLLGDLRKLDVDRQIKAEELKRVDADAARVQSEL